MINSIIGGVIQNNSVEYLYEEAIKGGVDLTYEEWKAENPDASDDDYPENDGCTYLIGFKKGEEGLYIPDKSKEVCAIVNYEPAYTSRIVYSKYAIKCGFASPCYPNQGDVDSEGEEIAYIFPPSYFEDENLLVKRIFKIEKGQ